MKKTFVNNRLLIIVFIIYVVVFVVASMILYITNAEWYLYIIIYIICAILLFFCTVMPILKFIIFTTEYMEIWDYKCFFKVKKTLIPTRHIIGIEIFYGGDAYNIITYSINDIERKIIIDYNYKILKKFVECMPKIRYTIAPYRGKVPHGHLELLEQLNIKNRSELYHW